MSLFRAKTEMRQRDQMLLDALIDHREEHPEDPTLKQLSERSGLTLTLTKDAMRRLVLSGAVERHGERNGCVYIPTRLEAHTVRPVERPVCFES